MGNSQSYTVKVYHFNVLSGDSTLVIVADRQQNLYGVLIDGGIGGAWRATIRPALGDIQTILTRAYGTGNFKLAAIVVTHEDEDHKDGIIEMLNVLRDPGTQPSISSYFYNQTTDNGQRTRFYSSVSLNRLGLDPTGLEDYIWFVPFSIGGYDYNYIGKELIWGEPEYAASISTSTGPIVPTSTGQPLANGVSSFRQVPNIIASRTDGAPGLYCVGVNKMVIQKSSQVNHNSITLNPKEPNPKKNVTNRSSIILVLTDPTDKIIHYFGGDAPGSIEQQFVNWKNNSTNVNDISPCMKFSHHGSASSTPVELITSLQPGYGVLSAGYAHGHPSWPIIAFCGFWNFYNSGILGMYANNYPYYLQPPTAQARVNAANMKNYREAMTQIGASSLPITGTNNEKQLFSSTISKAQSLVTGRWTKYGIPQTNAATGYAASRGFLRLEYNSSWGASAYSGGDILGIQRNGLSMYATINYQSSTNKRKACTELQRPTALDDLEKPISFKVVPILRVPSPYPSTSYTLVLIGSLGSVPPSYPYFMYLQDGCVLNAFVNALPGFSLVLQDWIDTGNGSTLWGGGGVVTDSLASWFGNFGLSQVQIQISNSALTSNNGMNVYNSNGTQSFASVSNTQITIVSALLTIGSSQISLQGASGGSMIQTTGPNEQMDWALSLALNASAPLSNRQVNVLNLLTTLQLITSGAGFLGTFGTQTLTVDPSTALIFDPSQLYSLNLSLAIQIGSNTATIIPGVSGSTNPLLAVQGGLVILNQMRTYISNATASDSFSWGLTTQILINGTFYGQGTLLFQDGTYLLGSLQLSSASNAGSLVATLFGSSASYTRAPFQAIDSAVNQDPVFGANVGLQLYLGGTTPTLVSMAIGGSLTLSLTSTWSLSFALTVAYPNIQIYGTATFQQNVSNLIANCPSCLQTATVTNFELYADAVGNYSISALLDATSSTTNIVGPLSLSSVSIELNKKVGTSFDVQITALLVLEDPSDLQLDTTTLQFAGGYIDGQWLLSVWVSDFSFLNLLTMVPSGTVRDTVREMIPNIDFVQASFEANLSSNTFQIQATVALGGAFFDFLYEHIPANTTVTPVVVGVDIFNFNLSSSTGDINLGSLFTSLGVTTIPSLIANLNLPFAAINLNYNFSPNVLTLSAANEAQSFKIILSRYINTSDTAQYFLRIIITGVSGFPLVGEVTLPLESFFLVYATDSAGINKTTFTTTLALQDEPDPVSYNALAEMYTNNSAFTITDSLQAFILGNAQVGIIGPLGATPPPTTYTGQNTQSSPSTGTPTVGKVGDGGTPGGPSGSNTPATWIKIQKSYGPIYINRIGFSVGSTVWILLDARLTFGPLMINFQGLSIGLQISPLQFEPQFTLSGLGIDYSSGNLSINGSLLRVNPPPSGYVDLFQGGVTISYKPYTITAIGSYGRALNPNGDGDIVTFFVFGRVKAPFGGPPEAYVTGLAAGFGYNQTLNLPTIDNVNEFPLVQGAIDLTVLSDDPFTTLQALFNTGPSPDLPWIVPNFNDGKWLAVGVDFNTYGLIDTRALLTVGFGDLLEIAILGRSVFSLPKGGPSIPKYVYLEIGLRVLVQPDLGFWGVSAVLSPNSYVMGPFCKVQGGFAWFNWFGNSPHAGDFVFTVGGYHPRFVPPSHYPVVDRVGYGWQYSDNISIGGQAYFALTPNCVMAGGSYNLNFHAGDLRAWFKAQANAIVYWNPFWFDVDVGIRIGASYRVNCLFFSFNISVELGADLEIWGPPIGGRIDVDLGPFGFTIEFGQGKNPANTYLNWTDFLKTLPQNPSGGTTYLNILPSRGVVPVNTPGQVNNPGPWTVRGNGFEFRVEFTFPATYVVWSDPGSTNLAYGTQQNFSLRQMNIPSSSTSPGYQALYQIQVTPKGNTSGWQMRGAAPTSPPSWAGTGSNDVFNFNYSGSPSTTGTSYSGLETTNLPAAIWGTPLTGTAIFNSSDPVTVSHASAVSLIAPPASAPSSILASILVDNLLTSAISVPLLASQIQSNNDPYWPTLASITPTTSNPGVIGLIKSALSSSSVTASRTSLVATLNAGLTANGAQPVYVVGTMAILDNYVEVIYPDPPLSFTSSSATGSLDLTITALSIDYSTTQGNTYFQFTVGGNSIVQGLDWIYTIYINDIVIVGPVTITNTTKTSTQIVMDQNVGFIYNPWTNYTVVVQDTNGNTIQGNWPLDL